MHGSPATDLAAAAAPAFAAFFTTLAALYLYAAHVAERRYGVGWPARRAAAWCAGLACAAAALIGPLPALAQHAFAGHMLVHLLLGMLAPLPLVFAAPLALALRALPVAAARRLARLVRSRPLRIAAHPAAAAALHVGGQWLLYATPLYERMHHAAPLYLLVHAHLFLAGFLFTASIVAAEPAAHRAPWAHRAAVLLLAAAAHDILAKLLYARPPAGGAAGAEAGAMLMYYAGDAVHLAMTIALGWEWYRRRAGRSASRTPYASPP